MNEDVKRHFFLKELDRLTDGGKYANFMFERDGQAFCQVMGFVFALPNREKAVEVCAEVHNAIGAKDAEIDAKAAEIARLQVELAQKHDHGGHLRTDRPLSGQLVCPEFHRQATEGRDAEIARLRALLATVTKAASEYRNAENNEEAMLAADVDFPDFAIAETERTRDALDAALEAVAKEATS